MRIVFLSQISTLNAALSLPDQNCLQPTDVLDLFRSFEFLKILAIDICILFRESEEAEDCSFLDDWRKRNDESFIIFMLALNQLYEFLSFGYFYFYIFSHFASFDWNVYTLNLLPKREKLPPQNIDTITIYIFLSLHLPFFNLLFPSFPLSFLSYRLQFNARETRSNFERGK